MAQHKRRHGFSLIEIMLVLVIIGIATRMISVSISPSAGDTLRLDARELAQRLSAAQQEVRIDGRLIVWEPRGDGYSFARGRWTTLPGSLVPAISTAGNLDRFAHDDILHPRRWRANAVEVKPGHPVVITSELMGEPLQLELHSGNYTANIVRNRNGSFQVQ